jgi:hypothetical protein
MIPPFFGSGVEFAVGKGTRAALPKRIVGFFYQDSPPIQGRHIPASVLNGLSPLDNHGPESQFHQPQGGKKACRSGTHDDHRWSE